MISYQIGKKEKTNFCPPLYSPMTAAQSVLSSSSSSSIPGVPLIEEKEEDWANDA